MADGVINHEPSAMKIEATFVRSAAAAGDLPCDRAPGIALVGRSNVGKSSVINALVRQRIARTSAAPGKTRLANVYRVVRAAGSPVYLVDLPGYGYARRPRPGTGQAEPEFEQLAGGVIARIQSALLLVDARHPGLESDAAAWHWLQQAVARAAVVATKIDKLARVQRICALSELESVFQTSVLPVSAVTGEGLDELWKLIDRTKT
jgi:GTP-binding protein